MKIMVIDDDTQVLESVGEALDIWDLDIRLFSDPKVALEACGREEFSLVLTDLEMPDIDGMEVLRRIIALNIDLPVVLYSGNTDDRIRELALSNGATAFMPKPLNADDFFALLSRLGLISYSRPMESGRTDDRTGPNDSQKGS